jgi:hypothetical protein
MFLLCALSRWVFTLLTCFAYSRTAGGAFKERQHPRQKTFWKITVLRNVTRGVLFRA